MSLCHKRAGVESRSYIFWNPKWTSSAFPYLGELVVGLIESDLEILDFLSEVSDITVSLVGLEVVFLGGIFELLDGGVET